MLITLDEAVVHQTPNAVMHRYGGADTAVWRTEMAPGAAGPEHVVDVEQVVVVVQGRLRATLGGQTLLAGPGDAVTLAAGALRRIENAADEPLVTLSAAIPGGSARVADGRTVPVPWAA